jgi:hypothetical protein
MERKTISRAQIVISIVLLFIFGATAGSLSTAWYLERRVHSLMDQGSTGTRKLIMARLKRELALSAEQEEKLEKSVEATQNGYAELRKNHSAEIDLITQRMTEESGQYLTPEQQAKFDQIRSKFLNKTVSRPH